MSDSYEILVIGREIQLDEIKERHQEQQPQSATQEDVHRSCQGCQHQTPWQGSRTTVMHGTGALLAMHL
jgi:hypothetical protein